MSESEYWKHLEFRVCHEFAGMAENDSRFLWCDGFVPDQYFLECPSPRVTGLVWVCNGRKQEQWKFTLRLNRAVVSRDDINWASLLPARSVTNWLSVVLTGGHMQIDLSEAVPDATL